MRLSRGLENCQTRGEPPLLGSLPRPDSATRFLLGAGDVLVSRHELYDWAHLRDAIGQSRREYSLLLACEQIGAGEQDPTDPVERIADPPAVPAGGLLDPSPSPGELPRGAPCTPDREEPL